MTAILAVFIGIWGTYKGAVPAAIAAVVEVPVRAGTAQIAVELEA